MHLDEPKHRKKRQPLRDARLAGKILLAAAVDLDRDRPIVTHLVVTRRCNLSCGYCFEHDKVSAPVPLATLKQRIDHLANLRSVFVTLTGGESLLHPDIVELVRYVRERGTEPFLNTNGYLLTREIVEGLNAAGRYAMQLSIDNARPNETSKKSLKPLRPKLRLLARHAKFRVRINTVLGSTPEEALEVARTVVAYGFDSNCSLVREESGVLVQPDPGVRDGTETRGALKAVAGTVRALIEQLLEEGATLPTKGFQGACRNILEHREALWRFVSELGVDPTNNHASDHRLDASGR